MPWPHPTAYPVRRPHSSFVVRITGIAFAKQPGGQISVQPHLQKYFRSHAPQIKSRTLAIPPHYRGGSRSSRTRGGMRWTRQRFACDGIAGRVARPVSSHPARGRETIAADGKIVWSRRPDAGVKFAEVLSALPGSDKTISANDGGKRARSPGRARHKPLKPLRAGMPGDSGVPVASTPVLSTFAQGAAGAAGTRHSPRPCFKGGTFLAKSRACRAAGCQSTSVTGRVFAIG